MKQCQFCSATFASEDAYQIHLGVGAPAFHTCHDANEMQADGMTQNVAGEWQIDKSLLVHDSKVNPMGRWARLKSRVANPDEWE